MKKILSICILCFLSISMLSGCSKSQDNGVVNISILCSKPEITSYLENAISEFSKENEDINIKIVKYNTSNSYYNKLIDMYEMGNAPTITMLSSAHIKDISDRFVDLSSEKWVKDIIVDMPNMTKNDDGKLVAFPFSIEGAGFIYNKNVINEAGIDINSINTIESLEEAFKKIESIGKKGLIITNEEWSLGEHFLSTAYSIDSNKYDNKEEYIESLKNGNISIKDNASINALIDTFDVMKKYNMYSEGPLIPSYNKCAEVMADGKVGFWYMGNWVSQMLLAENSIGDEFGFIPVPVSNDSSAYGNDKIVLGVTNYFAIDKENNSKEQQEAAKRFLNWLVYNEKGNDFMIKDAGVIPAFKGMDTVEGDPLFDEIVKYRDNKKTMEFMNSYLPGNASEVVGKGLKSYLNNEINREQLLEIIQNFWIQ